MSTTAKLTAIQQRVLGAVGDDWRSTREVGRLSGVNAGQVLIALYTRRFIDRRQIQSGLLPMEWRREGVD